MYALYHGKAEPVYLKDREGNYILDRNGNRVVDKASVNAPSYDAPVAFAGSISFASGESEAEAFGVSVGDYDSKLLMLKGEIPITETSLIFKESTPKYDARGNLDRDSADFTVVKVQPSLNTVVYLLKRVIHNA
jgi:hypothetical protein